jgi:outer membrane protein assembly factor BamB
MSIQNLVFVGFNSRVAALDRRNGSIAWSWKAHTGSGYVSILVDREHLFVSVNGYQYCLDAATGNEIWLNRMEGFGYGVTSIATERSSTDSATQQAAAAAAAESAAAAGAAGAAGAATT